MGRTQPQQQKRAKRRMMERTRTATPPVPEPQAPTADAEIRQSVESLSELTEFFWNPTTKQEFRSGILVEIANWARSHKEGRADAARFLMIVGDERRVGTAASFEPRIRFRMLAREVLFRHFQMLCVMERPEPEPEVPRQGRSLNPPTCEVLDFLIAHPNHAALRPREEEHTRKFLELLYEHAIYYRSPELDLTRIIRGLISVHAYDFLVERHVYAAIPHLFAQLCPLAFYPEDIERLYDAEVLVRRCEANAQADILRMVTVCGAVLGVMSRGAGDARAQAIARALLELIAMSSHYYRANLLAGEGPPRSRIPNVPAIAP